MTKTLAGIRDIKDMQDFFQIPVDKYWIIVYNYTCIRKCN